MSLPEESENQAGLALSEDIVLSEYEETQHVYLAPEELMRIRALPSGRVTPLPEGGDMYSLRTTHFVGTVGLGKRVIRILPKVSDTNLIRLLIRGELTSTLAGIATFAARRDVPNLLADLFLQASDDAVRRGVLQDYEERKDTLPFVRGRIDFAKQIRSGGLTVPVPCVYAARTADIRVNREILGAAWRLLRLGRLGSHRTRRLRHLVAVLSEQGVSPATVPNDAPIPWSRLNRRYRQAVGLADLVLRSMAIASASGAVTGASFLVNMNLVFQEYLAYMLRSRLAPYGLEVTSQKEYRLDHGGFIRFYPDLVVKRSGRTVLIIDAKYKRLTGSKHPYNEDVYQVAAYCMRLGVRRSALIFPEALERNYHLDMAAGGVELSTLVLPISGSGPTLDRAEVVLSERLAHMALAI